MTKNDSKRSVAGHQVHIQYYFDLVSVHSHSYAFCFIFRSPRVVVVLDWAVLEEPHHEISDSLIDVVMVLDYLLMVAPALVSTPSMDLFGHLNKYLIRSSGVSHAHFIVLVHQEANVSLLLSIYPEPLAKFVMFSLIDFSPFLNPSSCFLLESPGVIGDPWRVSVEC